MPQKNRPALALLFETNDVPTADDFGDLLASKFNFVEDTSDVIPEGSVKRFMTSAEKAKLAAIDATHYGAPLQDTTELAAIAEAAITDKQRRYIEDELSDYFYDATATSGDIAPTDQTGGTGFWKQVAVGGETAASVKSKYESNAGHKCFFECRKSQACCTFYGSAHDRDH
jgi:hypothetical protein